MGLQDNDRRLTKKAQPLSEREIESIKGDFIRDAECELALMGLKSEETTRFLLGIRSDVHVTPRLGPKHDVRYHAPDGGVLSLHQAVDDIAGQLRTRARLRGFGPDPETLLAERLSGAGLSDDEAKRLAVGRVKRLEDGRVIATRGIYDGGPAPRPDDTPERLAQLRDPNEALTRAARAIMKERATPASAPRRHPWPTVDARNAL